MKTISKSNALRAKCLFFAGLVALSFQGVSQKAAVLVDPKLESMDFVDGSGKKLDAQFIQPGQTISLTLPVSSLNHGNILPAGSCKIKINLGSKMELEPGFDLNDVNLDRYFHWTTSTTSGTEINGELVAPLPASFKAINLSFKVRGTVEGTSTITANFLITNHKTTVIMSDEDGSNNGVALRYTVTKKVQQPALSINDLELNVFPNPVASNAKSVVVKAGKGVFNGEYQVSLIDMKGGVLTAKELSLNYVSNFTFQTGNISTGMYILKVMKADGSESGALKVSKL
jgi:hypothetical protein